jgi:hypothetical protein
MKKNKARRLKLSRETLQNLQDLDSQKVMGGIVGFSPQSDCWCPSTPDDVCVGS